MTILRTLFWLVIAAALVTIGLGNRDLVTLHLFPPPLEEAFRLRYGTRLAAEVPLFLVILGAVAVGLLVGFVWEWIREIPERAQARATRAELERLRAEVGRLGGRVDDDVLSLIEPPRVARR